ncbi:DUF6652 family protein [Clostridium folliculivorans]|uniref:Uncharacterized protein n=1 Tax=Clostridium folliculivorans TaxID=2886038 RepID=A0A9W5Y211_9CLOT|nr:DUF6652 family protein [Clostridium folliculivorans]GKU25150.1 hypothetical protein CFOLD11_19760 [Clostridium folliculivorans]GKU31248.1 hypothetical protein CFB3_33550 [Clostridium folliculivorans]
MKNVKNTLIGLYFNLFIVILSLLFLLRGLTHSNMYAWLKWIFVFALIVSETFNIVFAGINAVNSFILLKNSDYNSMRKNMKALKFGVIPYFVINFIIYALLFLLFFAASRGLIVFTPIPLLFLIPVFFAYLTVIFTSSYGIGFSLILYKEKRIKTGKLVLHMLLQLCFVLDVIDTIILVSKNKVVK